MKDHNTPPSRFTTQKKCLSSRVWESIRGSIVLPALPTSPRKQQWRNRWSSPPPLLLVPSAVPQRPPILRCHLHPALGSPDPARGSQQVQSLCPSFCLTAPVSPSFSCRTLLGPQASPAASSHTAFPQIPISLEWRERRPAPNFPAQVLEALRLATEGHPSSSSSPLPRPPLRPREFEPKSPHWGRLPFSGFQDRLLTPGAHGSLPPTAPAKRHLGVLFYKWDRGTSGNSIGRGPRAVS